MRNLYLMYFHMQSKELQEKKIYKIRNFRLFNVIRNDEFSPLKNSSGKDSPETCKQDLKLLYEKNEIYEEFN